jgi:glucosamine 6-phosphate synthetase-like amidotransferase/phosphosugar isomerase protein
MHLLNELHEVPGKVEATLKLKDQIKAIAAKYADAKDVLYLGVDIISRWHLKAHLNLKRSPIYMQKDIPQLK